MDKEGNLDEARNKTAGSGGYACTDCGKVFQAKSYLRLHRQVNHNDNRKIFECPHCQMQFTYKGSMKRHLQVHEKKKDLHEKSNQSSGISSSSSSSSSSGGPKRSRKRVLGVDASRSSGGEENVDCNTGTATGEGGEDEKNDDDALLRDLLFGQHKNQGGRAKRQRREADDGFSLFAGNIGGGKIL